MLTSYCVSVPPLSLSLFLSLLFPCSLNPPACCVWLWPCCHSLLPLPLKVGGRYVFTPVWLFVCLSVNRTSQNVVDGIGRNLVNRFDVWQGRNDEILVKIQIRILEFLKWYFTIERLSQKLCIPWCLKKWMDYEKTSWLSWWGYKNKQIRFGLRSRFRSNLSEGHKV